MRRRTPLRDDGRPDPGVRLPVGVRARQARSALVRAIRRVDHHVATLVSPPRPRHEPSVGLPEGECRLAYPHLFRGARPSLDHRPPVMAGSPRSCATTSPRDGSPCANTRGERPSHVSRHCPTDLTCTSAVRGLRCRRGRVRGLVLLLPSGASGSKSSCAWSCSRGRRQACDE